MKKYKFLFFIILFTTLLVYPVISSGAPNNEEDNYGRVIGQIVDPETGEAVKEPFYINIYDSDINSKYPDNIYQWGDKTDDRGKFEMELIPYTFYLQFIPVSSKSKYCQSPPPFCLEEKDRDAIKIEPGKITYFKKKATIGGVLKIFLADMNNVPFNPKERFKQKFKIRSIIGEEICKMIDQGKDDLNDGELIVYRLFEGMYWIDIEFEGLGFKNFKKKNILVENGKTTEVMINLDLTDITGIEGFVTDAAGVPVAGVDILFGAVARSAGDTIGYIAISNKEGYYRLTGMPEGEYEISYVYERENNKGTIGGPFGYIVIKKNVLKRLDVQLRKTIAGAYPKRVGLKKNKLLFNNMSLLLDPFSDI